MINRLLAKLNYYIFERKSKWNYLIIMIMISPLFIYIYNKQSPVKAGNYTIGYASKMYWPIISYKRIRFNYIVNGKKYETTNIYAQDSEVKIPARYLVQFSLEDNSFSTIYPNIPIPDSIQKSPPGGWKTFPEWAKK